MNSKNLLQKEFGANAPAYVKSQSHRMGASLSRLLALVPPKPNWRVLDVASAIGYTAFVFAPYVKHVWSTDITTEMLDLARQEATARGLANVTVEYADAEALPYDDNSFDLVTCRIAPHHFEDASLFVAEGARVLRRGGILAVVDNVVPDDPGGDYVNAFEKLRDRSHNRCFSLREWLAIFSTAGLVVTHSETVDKEVNFEFWAKRHDAHTQLYLRTMLAYAPKLAADFLRPTNTKDGTLFHLQEGIIIGRKNSP